MGVSCTAYAIIGYRIRFEPKEERRRKCHHPEVVGANFCPACGVPMWENVIVGGIGEAEMELDRAIRQCGWQGFETVSLEDRQGTWLYVGYGLHQREETANGVRIEDSPLTDIDGLRNALQLLLFNMTGWSFWSNETSDSFGLWCVNRCG